MAPSSDTIASTDLTTFAANTLIQSAKVNTNFGIWRGHNIPVDASTSAAANGSYDLGSSTYRWRYVFGKPVLKTRTETTTYAAAITDDIIFCTAGADWTLTLPSASGHAGKPMVLMRTDATDGFIVTIDGNASETINGNSSVTLATQYESWLIVSDGSNWVVLEHRVPQDWITFTPTGSWSTNTTYAGRYRRVGDTMEVQIHITLSGAPTSATLTVNLPSGFTIDTAKLAGGTNTNVEVFGTFNMLDSGTKQYTLGGIMYESTTAVRPRYDDGASGSGNVTQAAPFTFANGDIVGIKFSVPIANWYG